MKFAIIGAGAMGSIIGGYLRKGGSDVSLVDPYREHINAIRSNGLDIECNSHVENIRVKAFASADDVGEVMDVIIIFTKGYFTRKAAEQAKCLVDDHTQIVTFQNGLGNPEILAEVYGRDDILYGIVQFGGRMLGAGYVRALINPTSKLILGSMKKTITPEMKEIQAAFKDAGLTLELTERPDDAVWGKMLGNCQNNVLCGITRLELGPYFASKWSEDLAEVIDKEIRAVAEAKGVTLPPPPEKYGGHFTRTNPMYNHLASTAQDMLRGKPTEIDNLNGAIVAEGKRLGVPTPVNEAVTWICRIIQENYLNQF